MYSQQDPIIARATAQGQGGIGVIRISSQKENMQKIRKKLGLENCPDRYAKLKTLYDESSKPIDQVIALYFQGPHSYTGEDVLEIQAHGGFTVLNLIIEHCLSLCKQEGLRLAQPGEFTQRAFLNGRLDLVQAEAVADVIEAGSAAAARAAARSLQGEFSSRIRHYYQQLIELRAYIEAMLDFPEEEVDYLEDGKIQRRIELLKEEIELVSRSAMRGKVLNDGLTVVLAGAPNVGKSSLMNRLVGDDIAIVTEVAGTTRDKIEQRISLDGLPVNLIDTAGIRQSEDKVECIGIERTLKAVEQADVVVHITDPSTTENFSNQADEMIESRLRKGVTHLIVRNKIDLRNDRSAPGIGVSALTGEGIDELVHTLKKIAGYQGSVEGDFIARTRHLECLSRSDKYLRSALENIQSMSLELVAEELRLAATSLGEILGEVHSDDILGMIFSKFCIGK